MRKLGILIFLLVVVLAGGAISSGLLNQPLSGLLIIQSSDPNASVFDAPPQQALQLVLWVGFVVFNLLGAGITLLLFFWLVNWGVKSVRSSDQSASSSTEIATTE